MSRKTDYAKKWIFEILEKKYFGILDEILHPEYFAEQHLTKKDREWALESSFFKVHGSLQSSFSGFNQDSNLPQEQGIERAKNRLRNFWTEGSIPTYKIAIHDIVEEGETVVIAYTHSFVHDQQYFGINPTNKEIKHNAVRIFNFQDDKIIKMKLLTDTYHLLAELGTIILNHGDEEQIQQYMAMLTTQHLIPPRTRE